jgi:K+ transporter
VPALCLQVGSWLRGLLRSSRWAQNTAVVLALLGTCCIMGDGVLTP